MTHFYVVCDHMVQTMSSLAAAESMATRLDDNHDIIDLACSGKHQPITAVSPYEARNIYQRRRARDAKMALVT